MGNYKIDGPIGLPFGGDSQLYEQTQQGRVGAVVEQFFEFLEGQPNTRPDQITSQFVAFTKATSGDNRIDVDSSVGDALYHNIATSLQNLAQRQAIARGEDTVDLARLFEEYKGIVTQVADKTPEEMDRALLAPMDPLSNGERVQYEKLSQGQPMLASDESKGGWMKRLVHTGVQPPKMGF